MKTVKRWISMALVLLLLAGCLPAVLPASAANANLALNKEVTTSSVRPKRSELVGALAVDGIDDEESSRWSSKMATGKGDNEGPSEDGTVEQWLMVDLGDEFNLSQIYISWEGAYATSYKIQTSVNGVDFVDIYANAQSAGGKQTIDKSSFTTQQSARYVKILGLTGAMDNLVITDGIVDIPEPENLASQAEHVETSNNFDTITASKIRLNLTDASRPSIYEFQLFYVDDGEPQPEANKTLLQKTYDYAVTLSTEGVTDAAKAAFEEALANAKAVLDDAKATQAEVDAAWDALLEGIWGLGLTQGDKTMLEQLIAKAEDMTANQDKYVQEHWQELVDALGKAKEVMDDGNAMEEDVQSAADALLSAILAQRFKADKSILEDLVNQAENLDLEGCTAESMAVFRSALAEAQAVMADDSLTEDDQNTVDAAVEKLAGAMDGLTAGSETQPSDKPETSQKPEATQKPENNVPQTGDSAPLTVAVLLFSAAAVALLALSTKDKRRA